METVILEKTIIKSKTRKPKKANTELHMVFPWGCGKYLLETWHEKNLLKAFCTAGELLEASEVGLSSGTRLWRGRAPFLLRQ